MSAGKDVSAYLDFFKNESWTKIQLPPNILFICPNEKIEKYASYFIRKTQEENSNNLSTFVSTKDLIKKQSILESVWQKIE